MMHEEPGQLVVGVNATDRDLRLDLPIHRLFEAQADRSADRIAVHAGNQSLRYREVDRRANQLAHELRRRGISSSSAVAVLLSHGIDTAVALLGVLKAGAAYVPLDPDDPPRRLRFAVNDAKARVVVTTSNLASVAAITDVAMLAIDRDEDVSGAASDARPDVQVSRDDTAYILYTSGSTGRPKGVAIPHRALVNYVLWANSIFQPDGALDFALHSSLAFDLTVTSIYCPLTTGGAIVAYPGRRGEPPILDVLRDDLVDVIKLTPSHLAIVVASHAMPSRLRAFVVGGENLDTRLARRVHERFDGRVAIFNEYGPTEATVGCMIHRFDPQSDRRRSVPIGIPAANTRIYLLDEQQQPVAPNSEGEIYVGGTGLASGYVAQPLLTAQRFVPDPFRPGERVYRTGDRARCLPEGVLEFCGRADDEIKMKGHRIDLEEIRHVLLDHPLMTDCVVRRLEEADGRGALVAYCVARETMDADTLRAFAAEHMTLAAVPGALVFLDQLPMTRNGKVDQRALPGLDVIRSPWRAQGDPPRTAAELILADIWQRLLRCERIGTSDRFFHLGGDSLAAVQLLEEVDLAFGIRLPTDALFPDSTLASLATAIQNRQPLPKHSALVAIRPAGERPPLFLVHGIGGEVLSYGTLVQHLDPRLPVYGLQRRVRDHRRHDPLSIESMAAEYLEVIRGVQRCGPYFLGGYSAGGVIACEIARQAQAAGQQVALLAIIDGTAPPMAQRRLPWSLAVPFNSIRNFGFWCVDDLRTTNLNDVLSRVRSRIRLWLSRVKRMRQLGGSDEVRQDVRDVLGVPSMGVHNLPWLESYAEAINAYRPGAYSGRTILFRARTLGLFEPRVPDRGWSSIVPDLEVRVINGDHATILLEPRVRDLAEQLDKALSEAAIQQAANL